MYRDLDVGMKCIKYMLFVSNLMFAMIGFLLVLIGSTIHAIYYDFDEFLEGYVFSPSSLAIAIGLLIFVIAIFGCVGAIKESTCLVNLFALFLGLVLILEIAASIAAYCLRGQIEATIDSKMNDMLQEYNDSGSAKTSWNDLQSNFLCCGVHSTEDWQGITFNGTKCYANYNNTNPLPDSCCSSVTGYPYKIGCLEQLNSIVSGCSLMLGTGALCVAFVQLLGVIFAVMLATAIRKIKTEEERKRQESRQRIYEQMSMGYEEKPVTPVLYTPTSSEA